MKKDKIKNEEVNPIAVVGFFLICSYLFIVYISYNATFPAINNFIDDTYIFDDPQGDIFDATIEPIMLVFISILALVGISLILVLIFYCTKHTYLAVINLNNKIRNKMGIKDENTKEETKSTGRRNK